MMVGMTVVMLVYLMDYSMVDMMVKEKAVKLVGLMAEQMVGLMAYSMAEMKAD